MLTLDADLRIPDSVLFTVVEEDSVLLNTRTNKYFSLTEVGARVWGLLNEGKTCREIHTVLQDEYEVDPAELEGDLLELLTHLMENGLVESASA